MINKHNKYLSLIIFAGVIYLIYLLIKPFISILLGSAVLAYAFWPLHKRILIKIKKPHFAAALTTILIFLIILLPLIFVLNLLAVESISAYHIIRDHNIPELISGYIDEDITSNIQQILDKVILFFVQNSSNVVLTIPQLILDFILFFFLLYYLLIDGRRILETIKNHLPSTNKQLIVAQFEKLTKALIYGTILIAIVQGILGGIGFWIFGVASPVLWGSAMAIASFIPLIGTAIVWLPAALFKLFQGEYISGIGLLLFGVLIISMVDNFLRPYLVSSKAKVHPAIVLIGVLGGIELLGFTGIILGPLFLSLALEILGIRDSQ